VALALVRLSGSLARARASSIREVQKRGTNILAHFGNPQIVSE
jgi:hypothetical protein